MKTRIKITKLSDLKKIVNRTPFSPFTLVLKHGKTYRVKDERGFGAPRNLSVIWLFTKDDAILVEPGEVVEVLVGGANAPRGTA
jgi:hypothetical protein